MPATRHPPPATRAPFHKKKGAQGVSRDARDARLAVRKRGRHAFVELELDEELRGLRAQQLELEETTDGKLDPGTLNLVGAEVKLVRGWVEPEAVAEVHNSLGGGRLDRVDARVCADGLPSFLAVEA